VPGSQLFNSGSANSVTANRPRSDANPRVTQCFRSTIRPLSEHEYGNGVAIFTRDGDTARDFTSRVQVGMVGVNVPIPVPVAYYTFGGWKRSGFGDLNQHGPASIQFCTKVKTVTQRWPSGIKDGAEFSIPTMK
jgi:malonate-semialdehyde dehydrogenase (acetylating) / methylmalonate-semialdehyde dehydrogenase